MTNILIVEDDEAVQSMLRKTLELEGYNVSTAENGRVGVRAYQEKAFDLVITDLIMPDMDGIETIISLLEDDPDAKIIAISGGGLNNPDGYLEMAKRIGAAKIFSKPLDRKRLLGAVKELTTKIKE